MKMFLNAKTCGTIVTNTNFKYKNITTNNGPLYYDNNMYAKCLRQHVSVYDKSLSIKKFSPKIFLFLTNLYGFGV